MAQSIIDNFLRYDFNLLLLFSSRREDSVLKNVFTFITRLGDGEVYGLLAVWQLLAGGETGRLIFMILLTAFVIELPVYLLLKNSVKRLRPFERYPQVSFLIQPPDHYSFPSGHTAAAFLMAHILSWQFAWLALPLYVLASLIGYSRIYLRVHYPSDVIFGMLLGLLSAKLALHIFL